jgi:hypothetical protein
VAYLRSLAVALALGVVELPVLVALSAALVGPGFDLARRHLPRALATGAAAVTIGAAGLATLAAYFWSLREALLRYAGIPAEEVARHLVTTGLVPPLALAAVALLAVAHMRLGF